MLKHKITIFISVFIAIAGLSAFFYADSLNNPFIWDDELLVLKNPFIRNWIDLPRIFISDLYTGSSLGSNFYRPLQTLSYFWDYHIWWLDPFGYHLTNLILHILVSFLVFLFAKAIIKEPRVAFASALFFALNPLHTEAITYISGRAEPLMGLFLLGSFLLFIRGKNILAWVAFIFALLSKELSVVFPFAILAYLFYYRKDDLKRPGVLIKKALPFFIISGLYILSRLTFLHFETFRLQALAKIPLVLRITVLPRVILTYFKLLFVPVDLHMSWSIGRPVNFLGFFLNWFLLGMICAGCGYILRDKKQTKIAAFMLAWALIFFLPQSGLFPGNAFLAEHFIYLSSISFFMLAAYLLHKYLRRELFVLTVACLSVYYGLLTSSRNADWQDPVVFYEKILEFSPSSTKAHVNLGVEYERRNFNIRAAKEYKQALEVDPNLIEARSNLANVYVKMGKLKEARIEYARAQKNVPPSKAGELQNNIATIDEAEGLYDLALEGYNRALRLDPKIKLVHFNIAKIYVIKGKRDLASQELLLSLPEISPADVKFPEYRNAVLDYLKPLKDTGAPQIFYNDLGVLFASRNLIDGAIPAFKRAIELAPLYDDARYNLGLAFWKKGLKREAISEFKTETRLNPNYLKAKEFLSEIVSKNN